jgi:cytochrome c oxidase assembly protein Cox11
LAKNKLWSCLLLPPFKAPKLRTSKLVACFRYPFSLAYVAVSYGCCCSYCSYNTRVEKEEVQAKETQEIQSQKKSVAFNIKRWRAIFIELN